MKTLLIGVGSIARVGKDYAAAKLSEIYDLQRIAFADELKKDLGILFEQNGLYLPDLLSVPTTKEMIRPLLVSYGQTMRTLDPDIWVRRALKDCDFTHQITMITDVRFPNEAEYIKRLGGHYVEIDTTLAPANETEAYYSPLMKDLADYTITNKFDGSFIECFRELIDSLLSNKRVDVLDFV